MINKFDFSIIKTLRKRRGLTLEMLSQRAGISIRTISDIELNKTIPSLPTISTLSQALKVSSTELFDYAQKNSPILIQSERTGVSATPNDAFDISTIGDLKILSSSFEKGHIIEPHTSKKDRHFPCREFCYILRGNMTLTIDDKDYTIEEKQGILFDSNLKHSYRCNESSEVIILYLPRDNNIASELASRELDFFFTK